MGEIIFVIMDVLRGTSSGGGIGAPNGSDDPIRSGGLADRLPDADDDSLGLHPADGIR